MGRKEENIKKAQALLHQKERIRNIGTAAHIDHGKCLSGDARTWVNGRWIRAEELWDRFADRPPVPNGIGADVRDVMSESLWTRSLDLNSGETSFAQITHVWRLAATEPLVEVETRDGRRIRTTPEHPFVVASGVGLAYKKACNLGEGDVLAVPRRLPSRDDRREDWVGVEEEMLLRLASDPSIHFKLTPKFQKAVQLDGTANGHVLRHIARLAGIRVGALYPMVEEVSLRRSGRGKVAQPIRLPNRTELEGFFWLLGLLYGDGDGQVRIHMNDEEMIERARSTMDRFTRRASISRLSRVPYLNPGSATFIRFLQVVFGYPARRKAWSIRLPPILHVAPLPLAASFIQGYFDADGTVEKARSAVSATSVSEEFLDELQLLLLRFGIRSILLRKKGKNTIYISGKKNLSRMPQFSDPEKAALQRSLEEKSSTSYVVDLLPVDWKRLAPNDWKSRFYATAGQQPSARSLLTMADVDLSAVQSLLNDDIAFVEVKAIRSSSADWVYDFSVPGPQNFVAEGLFIHNTTLSDSLIAGAGMISEELAGSQLFMDYDEQEQARGITINAAIASMVHDFEDGQYLINLIDTPGHVDFGGDVTRAMRAIDGVIILDDSVEGIMPQTETVIRQALKERVRPVLFINKVDRLVNELKITPEQMQQRFQKIITEVNNRIRKWLPPELGEKWMVSVEAGSVAFGSAFHKWAVSAPFTKRTGIGFKDVYKHCQEGTMKELSKKAPLHNVVLNMVIRHLPNPLESQKTRIPVIWKGDLESRVGKGMMTVDENGPVAFMVTKIIVDPQAGEVAAGRLFSGKVRRGQELWVSGMPKPQRAQTVAMIVGPDRIPVDEIDAGNVVAVVGLKDAIAGSTVSEDKEMQPFEKIVHYSDPVVTIAVEAKSTSDLPKLVEALRLIAKADPSIEVEINQETGEHLISGMGELHLEITIYRVQVEHKIPVTTSPPIVVYRECVADKGGPFEGKSPNKHNRFYMEVEPLETKVVDAIRAGEIASGQRIKDAKVLQKKLEELGMDRNDAKNVVWIQDTNMLIDGTKGIQYLHETMELIKEAYIEAMNRGPLAAEKGMALKVRLVDAKLHEDSVHRGPAQVIPAARSSIYGAMVQGGRTLLEPIQKVFINVPQDFMGSAIGEIQSRRGVIDDINQEGEITVIHAKAPVAEMFGFASAVRSATQGRALWSTENAGFEPLPSNLQGEVVRAIRTRKGLPPEPYDEAYYAA
jgi:elongation factor 2